MFKSIFKKKTNQDIKHVKTMFKAFLEGDEYLCENPILGYEYFWQLNITNIIIKENNTGYDINVTLQRPGFLIGKGGRVIDELEKRLYEYFNKTIDIHIEESTIWN